MVSCLTLLHDSHIVVRREGGSSVTACGLAVANEHVGPGFAAADEAAASCRSCRQAAVAKTDATGAPRDPRTFAAWLMRDVLNGNDASALAGAMSDELAISFSPARVTRLHDLFPAWQGEIADIIADAERVVLRYHATCRDPTGMLGAAGACEKRDQVVILRLRAGRLAEITPIQDDFGVWTVARRPI